MNSNRPNAAAWEHIRERMSADAAEYRQHGDTVVEVFADYSTVRQPSEQPITFSYTVPSKTVSRLQRQVEADAALDTQVQYLDVEQTRLYALEAHDTSTDLRVLIAGGIAHRALRGLTDTGPARTIVRSVTGTVPLELLHDSVTPFLAELE